MRKMLVFMMVSADGYFEGPDHDLSWHNVDPEFDAFSARQVGNADTLVFGRRTYELMARFWPTEEAKKRDPIVAEGMNDLPKIVFSRTLKTAEWKNTTLIKDHIEEEVRKLKNLPGRSLTVLGSSNLCVSLIEMGLLDEFQILVNPIILGRGTPLFSGLRDNLKLTLVNTRTFKSGNILLYYHPADRVPLA